MPNETDSNGYSSQSQDTSRDMGAKGGPTTTLGTPDSNHNISHPYSDDLQTQIAAKGNKKKDNDEDVKSNN